MTKAAQAILDTALKLSYDERHYIMEAIWDTLHPPVDEEVDFEQELRRRIEEIESGKVKPIAREDARRELFKHIDESTD